MNSLHTIATQFDLKGRISHIKPFGSGNINRTFLLTTDATPAEKIILQEINSDIFNNPRQVMENLAVVTNHMADEMGRQGISDLQWRLPQVIKSRDGQDYYIDPDSAFWRAIAYIDQTISYETISGRKQAEKAGIALGRFHRLTGNLDPLRLHDTLPGFHHAPEYLQRYDQVRQTESGRSSETHKYGEYCTQMIDSNREIIAVLEEAKMAGNLNIRTIHGDPKISNILFSAESGDPVSLIDLDTVKPGLIQYDIGDFFRSICNLAGEETSGPESVQFDIHRFESGLTGYISEMGSLLTEEDIEYIFDSIRLITVELGIRFYSDYLDGDVYFESKYETHNLLRAAVQCKLAESITNQEHDIRSIIKRITT